MPMAQPISLMGSSDSCEREEGEVQPAGEFTGRSGKVQGRGGAARRGIHGKVHQAAWAQGRTWKAMAEPTMTMARLAVLATD